MAVVVGSVLGFLEVIALCIVVLLALAVVLVVVIMKLPATHPLRALLTALAVRLGASAATTAMVPVGASAPVVGEVSEAAVILALLYFWLTFFWQLYLYLRNARWRPDPYAPAPAYVPAQPPPTAFPPEAHRRLDK